MTEHASPGRLSLTSAQRGIWFAQKLDPDNPMFQIAQFVDLDAEVDAVSLRHAVSLAVAETDALNVRFGEDANGPFQVPETFHTELIETDVRGLDGPVAAQERAHAVMDADLAWARDVETGSLLRTELIRVDDQRCFFYQRVHHLMLDGYSAVLMLKRVARLYSELLERQRTSGSLDGLSASPFGSLTDLLADEAAYTGSRSAEADKDYWAAQADNAEPASGLAGRPDKTAARLVRSATDLPPELSQALSAASASAPAVMLSAAAVYLHKMTGERDISLGLPVTARRGALAKSVPSMMSNIIPIRLHISPSNSVDDTVRATGAALRNALIHQRHRSGSTGSGAGYMGPSVNILPIIDDIRFGPAAGEMNILTTGPVDDLSIIIHGLDARQADETPAGGGSGATIQFEGNSALYDRQSLTEHLRRFTALAVSLATSPKADIAALSITGDTETRRLLALGTAQVQSLPGHTVVEEFEARAAATPHACAVVAGDYELSFAELDRRANQLAQYLRGRGAGPGGSVGVRLERSTLLAVAIIGVLKSGAAYLPLDPDYPAGRVEGMIEDAAPNLVLTTSDFTRHGAGQAARNDSGVEPRTELRTDTPVVALDSELVVSALAGKPAGRRNGPAAGTDDLAYIIFTSGSTGRPKGVGVEHRSLLNLFLSHHRTMFAPAERRLGRSLRVAHTAGLSFDASWDPLLWLFAGHELHLVDTAVRRDPEALTQYLLQSRIDSIETTPSFAKALLAQGLFEARARPSVVALGGEAVDDALWNSLAGIDGVSAYNFYGPTETTVDSLTAAIVPGTAPTIGTSVANSRHYILGPGLDPVPVNAIGELYVAGDNIARGYLGRPDLSSERFIADPFADDGSRMYRTGDLVRRLPDGGVGFLGRIDEQVKIRGFRIELSEVEEALRAADGVDAAVVIVSRNQAGFDQLLAYVTGPDAIDTDSIRRSIRHNLPDYMVPSALTQLDGIPLTANGKLDKKALPQPQEQTAATAPRNDRERAVAAAFEEVLGLGSVGVDADFFELGGHSLLATRLVAVLRARLGTAPPLREVFENPTIAELAERLDEGAETRNPLTRQDRPESIPLSFAQRRLWFLNQFEPGSGAYNIPIVLRLNGRLDVAALRRGINDVVNRHESIRTVFPLNADEPEQKILYGDESLVELPAVGTTAERLDSVIRAQSSRGFDVTREMPLRASLLQLGPTEHVLLVTLHHIAADGWSLAPLARDLSVAYNARLSSTVPEPEPLPVQYADYTLWQRAELGREDDEHSAITRQLRFWAEELNGAPEDLALPFDRPRGWPAMETEGMHDDGAQANVGRLNHDDAGPDGHPGDEPRAVPGDEPRSVPIAITPATHARLIELAGDHNASLFMVLQAAYAALLTKLGGGNDIPIGTPVAGRNDTALDDLVGFFVNTLVLRTNTATDPSAADLVDRVRFTNLRAYANQDAPFERVVEEINPARSEERHPLFQVMLTLQNTQPAWLDMDGLHAYADESAEPGGAKFDLLLDLAAQTGADEMGGDQTGADGTHADAAGITGGLGFNPALFDESTAASIAERFVRILEQFAATPDVPMSQLSVLSDGEYDLLRRQSRGPQTLPGTVDRIGDGSDDDGSTAGICTGTIIDELDHTCADSPTKPALSDGHTSLDFSGLQERVAGLAAGLVASGVAPGDRVAVALPRSVDVVAAALAVLRIRAVYVPVDLTYPAERIRLILADSAPRLVIAAPGYPVGTGAVDAAPSIDPTSIDELLQTGREAASGASEHAAAAGPGIRPASGDDAYVIYTSGSTGTPKGVAVGHAALANLYHHHRATIFAAAFADRPQGSPVNVAHIAGLGFDAAWDPVLWLIAGAHLHMVTDDIRTDAEEMVSFCAQSRIDVLETTPSYLRQLAASGLLADSRDSILTLILGGESVPEDLWQVLAGDDAVRAYNFYGPTEFTVDSLTAEVRGEHPHIGTPVGNVNAYVLDEHLQHVPHGVTGELYLSGAGSATGYVNRQGETAAKFVADPATPGSRMYRTGDLVRRLAGGQLEFVSRADDQVKVRGFRIELGEVESVLSSHPQLAKAAVIVHGDPDPRIVAYVAGDASVDELRQHAATRLPGYMVPTLFIPVGDIPLTSHGKLDRRALPKPLAAGSSARQPETEDERALCSLFGSVLGASDVGLDDDFFELGGHSLLAVTMIAQLRGQFGVDLPLRALFESTTPAALLPHLVAGDGPGAGDAGSGGADNRAESAGIADGIMPADTAVAPVEPLSVWLKRQHGQRPARIPASYAQSRMWFLNQMDVEASDYNISLPVRLSGPLQTGALATAIDDLLERHEVLRTIYPARNGSPEQLVLPAADLKGLLATENVVASDDELHDRMSRAASAGFDVTSEIPLRATLIRTGEQEWVLHLVLHHIASDGMSLAPLARDISTAYTARSGGMGPAQRHLPVQYADFTLWQRQMLDGGRDGPADEAAGDVGDTTAGNMVEETAAFAGGSPLEAKLAQWKDSLAGIPDELALPSDSPRPRQSRQHGRQHQFTLEAPTAKALLAFGSAHSASLFMVLHAALAGYLKRLGAGEDIVIGSPSSGRNDPSLEELIGFFVNTVPIRLDASRDPSFSDLLDRARNSVLDALDKDEVPFERLVESLNPRRELGRHPLFQTMLSVENATPAVVDLPGVRAVPEPEVATGEAKFDLSFTFREQAGAEGLSATLDYNASMFSPQSIESLVRRFQTFLARVLATPDASIAGIEVVDADEAVRLIRSTAGPVDTATDAPESILEAFAVTVARSPQETAVVHGDVKLTFAELDVASAQIAAGLRHAGVERRDLVSVYLPRSPETISALLAVLKAGAIYNPIDTEYPAERVTTILEDAGPAAVLTSAANAAELDAPLARAGVDLSAMYMVEDLQASGSAVAAPQPIHPDDSAYAMFTSGSTGRPKGVEVSHGSLANLLASHRRTILPGAPGRDGSGRLRVAHTTGVGFDASWDPILWMVEGHELHLIANDIRRNPQDLAGYFAGNGIGAWESTPSYLRQLMGDPVFSALLDERAASDVLPPLRLALGGEALDDGLWAELRAHQGLLAWNLYGPTEATVDSIVADLATEEFPTLGTPVLNTAGYVLDDHLQHVPAGSTGELYLAGPQLARGYRGRTDLTAERFVADPFGAPGGRMYRTGDLVTRHGDGRLVFMGRNDNQLKIRGFRVEPDEIERVLRSVAGVREAVVRITGGADGTPDDGGAPARLAAYVVPEGDSGSSGSEIDGDRSEGGSGASGDGLVNDVRSTARSALPEYMVPSAVVVLEAIPLTPHGKLDTQALPDPSGAALSSGLAPRTPRENAVAGIFAEVLALPTVGVDESFFDLGGHSFLAQRLISSVNRALGSDLPVQSLFRSPSVEQLVREASKGRGESVADSLRRVLPLRTAGSKPPLFAVHPATGVSWGYAAMLSRLDPDRPLIGLQMPAMVPGADTGVTATTLTGLADDYIVQLKSVQAEGPYHLIGWSFGGNLIQRIAARLQERGDDVAFLGILDAYPTNQETNSDIGTGAQLWVNYLHAVGYPVPDGEAETLDGARVLGIIRENGNPLGNVPLESVHAMVENFSVLARLIRQAPVEPFDGDLYFFTAMHDVPPERPSAAAWQPFISGRIIDTPVHERHSQMLSEQALTDIAPILAIHLDGRGE